MYELELQGYFLKASLSTNSWKMSWSISSSLLLLVMNQNKVWSVKTKTQAGVDYNNYFSACKGRYIDT